MFSFEPLAIVMTPEPAQLPRRLENGLSAACAAAGMSNDSASTAPLRLRVKEDANGKDD